MVGGQHGRPGVALTELRQVFERLVARGVSNSEACRVVGINRRTGTRWRYGRGIPASGGRTLHYPPVVTPKRTVASSSRCAAPRAGLHCPARLPRRRSLSGSPQPCGSAPLPSPPERARPFPSSPARPWRNGSRTRGDERRAASARGGHRPRGGVAGGRCDTSPGGGVRRAGRRPTELAASSTETTGGRVASPVCGRGTRWRTGGLHRPDQGDDPTCRLAPVAERERGDEDEQRDQNGERADDDPRHPGHSGRQHHHTTSSAKVLSHCSSSSLVIGTVVRGTPVPFYVLSCWQVIRGRAAGEEPASGGPCGTLRL